MTGRFAGWFSRAKSGIDAVPIARCRVRLEQCRRDADRHGQPMRVLGFDQALVWVTVALLALGPGDGVFGIDRVAGQPALRALATARPTSSRATRLFAGDRLHRRPARRSRFR